MDLANEFSDLWIIDECKGFKQLKIPKTYKKLSEISGQIQELFKIPTPYQKFYCKGKKIYDIKEISSSDKTPVGVMNIYSEGIYLINFMIEPYRQNFEIAIEDNKNKSKSLIDCLLVLAKSYDLSDIFCEQFELYDINDNPLTFYNTLKDFYLNLTEKILFLTIKIVFLDPKTLNPGTAALNHVIKFNLSEKTSTKSFKMYKDMSGKDLKCYLGLICLEKPSKISLTTQTTSVYEDESLGQRITEDSVFFITQNFKGGNAVSCYVDYPATNCTIARRSDRPEWEILKGGMSLVGVCNTDTCPACENYVVCNFGYGVYDLSRVLSSFECPECGELVINKVSCGFLCTKWKCSGVTSERKRFERGWEYVCNQYTYFEQALNIEWSYLTITCKKNKKVYKITEF
jgi:hypothetical protein